MTGKGVVAAGIVLWVAAASAQQRPNFSGRWVAVSPAEAAGQEQVIEHDATSLAVSHASTGAGHRAVYKLDGTESRNVLTTHGEDIVTMARAAWKDNQLTITSSTSYPDGRRLEKTQAWSLDGDGRLVIDMTDTMQGQPPARVKLVYTKR